MASTANWPVDDIDDVLAADFDGSLSGLGMELGTSSFNMRLVQMKCLLSEGGHVQPLPQNGVIQQGHMAYIKSDALMALPSISALKQENGRENGDASHCSDLRIESVESLRAVSAAQAKKTRLTLSADEDVSSAIKRFCVSSDREDGDSSQSSRQRHSSSVPDLRVAGSQPSTPVALLSASMRSHILQISDSPPPTSSKPCTLKNSNFQYVLGAATSIATKIHEETMTYLNQGQSYEIKLKKLGDLTEMRGKMLKSVVRVGFQERRLQYMEKEQIVQWQQQRPRERILEIDVPLSYGVYEVVNDPNNVHVCEFLWDPTKETGVFVRVNCISTEFTPKKHGGEKGVPFRIQIETFSHDEDGSQRLHAASCQVKVFKPKGADRKHKTDREKMSKRPQSEQEKFKPSYDCTVFSECVVDSVYTSIPVTTSATSNSASVVNTSPTYSPQGSNSDPVAYILPCEQNPSTPGSVSSEIPDGVESPAPGSNKSVSLMPDSCLNKYTKSPVKEELHAVLMSSNTQGKKDGYQPLSSEANSSETAHWLEQHRFGSFVQTFSSFSGADILRLTRDDLIQICGLADGIRLYNALHSRAIRPRLTMYVCTGAEQVFRAVYLENLTCMELARKLASLFNLSIYNIHDIYVTGPSAIHVVVSDEVVQNMLEESMFVVEFLQGVLVFLAVFGQSWLFFYEMAGTNQS